MCELVLNPVGLVISFLMRNDLYMTTLCAFS
jgi:hypothetical protein